VQGSQLAGGLDADLLDERPARRAIGLERLGLATAPVQRQHQLAAEALAKRLFGDRGLQLCDDVLVAAEHQLRFDASLERRPAPLLEPRDLGLRERLVREVGERRTAPQLERLPEHDGGALRIEVQLGPPAGHELLEAVDVTLARPDLQAISAPARLEPAVPAELPSQGRHLVVEHPLRRPRRRLPPQILHQPIRRHQLVRPEDQKGEQGPLSPRANREGDTVVADHLERAKQAEVQNYENRNIAVCRP
jgi:hypothetical protein